MAIVTPQNSDSTSSVPHARHRKPPHHVAPVTSGKVALWIFLATEIMFFTGLIGSYIVLRVGSPSDSYSNAFRPATPLAGQLGTYGVVVEYVGAKKSVLAGIVQSAVGIDRKFSDDALEAEPFVIGGLSEAKAEKLRADLTAAGGTCRVEPLRTSSWPKPFDRLMNPLSVELTALNTLILGCSSFTMMLALSAIQKGKRWRSTMFLGATVLIGTVFLAIQAYEYRELLFERRFPAGISASGHFRPDSSLFASCFFAMTGFHGAHVTAGVVALLAIFVRSLFGVYSKANYASIEVVGLYWHFVDLVWVVLFTIVYLI
jgi:cytochrome c oxidase subunit III